MYVCATVSEADHGDEIGSGSAGEASLNAPFIFATAFGQPRKSFIGQCGDCDAPMHGKLRNVHELFPAFINKGENLHE